MASVIGLAPIRPDLKGRLRELLCIHGQEIVCISRPLRFPTRVMKVICPKCRHEIPLQDVNVSTDIALCRICTQAFALSELVEAVEDISVDPDNPPKGAWFHHNLQGFEVGATTRSAAAFFLVPFMCVWSGFSLGGIYGSQIIKGQFNLGMSLFGIPFLLGTILFGSIAVMTICGKVCVRVQGSQGEVFTGVGPIGWRRRFEWNGVTSIRMTERMGRRGSTSNQITMEGAKRLDLGSGVNSERLDFMLGVLRRMRQNRF